MPNANSKFWLASEGKISYGLTSSGSLSSRSSASLRAATLGYSCLCVCLFSLHIGSKLGNDQIERVLTIVSVQNITCGLFHHHLRILPSAVNPSGWVYICALLWKWELRNNNSLTKMWFRLSRVVSVTSQETSFVAMHEATVISLTHTYSKLVSKCTWLVAVRQHGILVVHSHRKRKWFYGSFYSHWFSANHSHSSETDTGFEFPASNYLRETPSAEIRVYRLPSNYSTPRKTNPGFEFPVSEYPWRRRQISQLVSYAAMFFWPGDRQTDKQTNKLI